MRQIEGTSLLVTIAEDLPNEPVLKVWALDKIEKKTGAPRCLSTVSVQNGRRPFPVSVLSRVKHGIFSDLRLGIYICLPRRFVTSRCRFRKRFGGHHSG